MRPLIAFRDYHSTTHQNDSLDASIDSASNAASIQPYPGLPRLHFAHNAEHLQQQGYWYKNFLYRVERERGLDFEEDLFNPFVLSWELNKKRVATVVASTDQEDVQRAGGPQSRTGAPPKTSCIIAGGRSTCLCVGDCG